jgi:hypothetical protein
MTIEAAGAGGLFLTNDSITNSCSQNIVIGGGNAGADVSTSGAYDSDQVNTFAGGVDQTLNETLQCASGGTANCSAGPPANFVEGEQIPDLGFSMSITGNLETISTPTTRAQFVHGLKMRLAADLGIHPVQIDVAIIDGAGEPENSTNEFAVQVEITTGPPNLENPPTNSTGAPFSSFGANQITTFLTNLGLTPNAADGGPPSVLSFLTNYNMSLVNVRSYTPTEDEEKGLPMIFIILIAIVIFAILLYVYLKVKKIL